MKTYKKEKSILGQAFRTYKGTSELGEISRFNVCMLEQSEC